MATQSTTPQPTRQTLPQILAALQSIAAAVNRGTDVIVAAADERPASQEQSTAIVDYLVLRELMGRQADEVRRTAVRPVRGPGGGVRRGGPGQRRTVAVFTRRRVAPARWPTSRVGPIAGAAQEAARTRGSGGDPGSGSCSRTSPTTSRSSGSRCATPRTSPSRSARGSHPSPDARTSDETRHPMFRSLAR